MELTLADPLRTALAHYLALRAGIHRGSRLLEVGCGAGATSLHLTGWFGCHLTAVDRDEEALARAVAAARERGLEDRARFLRMPAGRLDLPQGAFDVALAWTTHNGSGRDDALLGIRDALRPGGRLAIAEEILERHPEPWDEPPREALRTELLTLEEYRRLLERLDLQVLHTESCPYLMSAAYQPVREWLLQGHHEPRTERECREYDRIGHRFLGWGLLLAEKRS